MLRPLSYCPADTACLAGVGGVNVRHNKSGTFCFVGGKFLQLPKGPAVEAGSHPAPSFDVIADIGKVFQSDFSRPSSYRLHDNGFTDFMVNMLHMPMFTPGDSKELTLSGSATVGLKTPTMGKIDVTPMAQGTTTKHLASASSSKIVFSNINTHRPAPRRSSVRDIEAEVKVPDSFANKHASFFGHTRRHQVGLVFSAGKGDQDASGHRKQAHSIGEQTVCALVETDGCRGERKYLDRSIFADTTTALESSVRIGYAMNSLADHLTPQFWEQLPHWVVAQVMQSDPVPCSVGYDGRHYRRARTTKRLSQISQILSLLSASQEFKGNRANSHIGKYCTAVMRSQVANNQQEVMK